MFGDKIYIGTDLNEENSWEGIVDEAKILSEMMMDARPTERLIGDGPGITFDYNNTAPSCPDEQTLALIKFSNPIKSQSRRLRNHVFLNSKTNNKFKLTPRQRLEL